MKKRGALFVFIFLFSLTLVSAQSICVLDATLINQDPYPAIPGEYVKVVFQLDGLGNANCGDVSLTLKEEFPFSLDPGEETTLDVRSGTYSRDFASFFLAPFEVRVDEDALEGENPLEITYSYSFGAEKVNLIKKFNITIEDTRVDFEIAVKDYEPITNIIKFEILNIGESDIEALTIEVPKQDNIQIKGSNRNIVGDLDSNDDTTFEFEAVPTTGDINLIIYYTDQSNARRMLEKSVSYDESYYEDRVRDKVGRSISFYLLITLVVVIVIIWFIRRRNRHKRRHIEQHHNK